ncbi:GDSL esterase/lipase 6 [Morella rubra]|uniref:GDSL esterase/lipase 6 n=1 Tax=Morella rubra TaxID=262757 RepID=A0A6A1UZ31_9ROSI|nr:GDSL esterase/lipase 6 [Morella rubra]
MLYEVQSFLDDLSLLGARRIALFSLGPVGCVPARAMLRGAPQHTCFEPMNMMTKIYNHGLYKLVGSKNRRYPGAVLTFGEVFNIHVHHIRLHPEKYGFFDVNEACCGSGLLRGEVQCVKGLIYQIYDFL